MRRLQNGDWSRYWTRFVRATIRAKNSRLMFIVSVSTPPPPEVSPGAHLDASPVLPENGDASNPGGPADPLDPDRRLEQPQDLAPLRLERVVVAVVLRHRQEPVDGRVICFSVNGVIARTFASSPSRV